MDFDQYWGTRQQYLSMRKVMSRHSSGNRRFGRVNRAPSAQSLSAMANPTYTNSSKASTYQQSYSSNAEVSHQASRPSPSFSKEERVLNLELRRQALNEARKGNHKDAIALFNELVKRDPFNASHYNNRGLVYFQMSELDKAISDYNQAIELNPSLDSAYNNRANYHACQGQLLSAILDYDIAIDLNPSNVRAWINQGITFRELHMFERAVECLDTALNFRRLEGNIYAERGRTYHLWGDWNVAIADYNQAIAILPFSADAILSAEGRLRLQVELWLDDLLGPLSPEVID